MGQQLLSYVSAANAARYGVTIHAEAVLAGQHGVVLILSATDWGRVERFLGFFAHLGEVQILPAVSAEEAVERGQCGMQGTDRPSPRAERRTPGLT
jgi:hypothetical protein